MGITSPEAWDLTAAPMSCAVKSSGVTADADGYYYKAGQLVEITGDEQVGLATNANKAVGILLDSITTKTNPNGLDARTRVSVHFFGFRKIFRVTAEGSLTAGARVTQGTVNKQYVKAASALTATVNATALEGAIASGATPVTSTAAQPAVTIAGAVTATLAGSILPEVDLGVVWKGATNGNQAQILAY